MGPYEKTKYATRELSAKLGGAIPALHKTINTIYERRENDDLHENPLLYIGKTYVNYLRLIRDVVTLDKRDTELMAIANNLSRHQEIPDSNAGQCGADTFLKMLGPGRQQQLVKSITENAYVYSEVFQAAIADVQTKLANCNNSDMKNMEPKVMIHYVMARFLESTFMALFANDTDPKVRALASDERNFRSALANMIMQEKPKGIANREIANIWSTDKERGGLGWISQWEQDSFDKVELHYVYTQPR